MKKLDKNTNVDELKARIGVGEDEDLRSSYRRQSHLEGSAQILAGDPEITVSLEEGAPAAVRMDDGKRDISIPADEMDQPVTGFERKVYDLLVQEALTVHEVGHVLYSDWPSFEKHREQVGDVVDDNVDTWRNIFHKLWNGFEDGAIERHLRHEFFVEDELTTLNANLTEQAEWGQQPNNHNGTALTVLQAVFVAIVDLGIYDSGTLDKLKDPDCDDYFIPDDSYQDFQQLLPHIHQTVADVQSESDGAKRNEICFEFFKTVKNYMDTTPFDGASRFKRSDGDGNPIPGKPDDADESIGEQREEMVSFGAIGGDENQEEDGPDAAEGVPQPAESENEIIAREVEGQEEYESLAEEIEEFVSLMGGEGTRTDRLYLPDPASVNSDTWRKSQTIGQRIQNILQDVLRQERRERFITGRTTGQFDSSRMVEAARGNPGVMRRKREGNEKNYSCTLILDRSGSMRGLGDHVETSAGAFMYALEEVGVDTMAIDFYEGKTRLVKAFGQPVNSARRKLFTGQISGGTPLTEALRLVRERIQYGGGTGDFPFVIVVTDGNAHRKSAYQEEINKCTFPVIGVYLRPGDRRSKTDWSVIQEEMRPYERWTVYMKNDDLAAILRDLAFDLMI